MKCTNRNQHGASKVVGERSRDRVEYASKTIVSNYWLKLGLSRQELGALQQIARLFEDRKNQTTGRAAALVLTTALMHWDTLQPLLFADREYAVAEGFANTELFETHIIARKFNLKKTGLIPLSIAH